MKIEEQTGSRSAAETDREPWEPCSAREEIGMSVFYLAERLCYRGRLSAERRVQSVPFDGRRLLASEEGASGTRSPRIAKKKSLGCIVCRAKSPSSWQTPGARTIS